MPAKVKNGAALLSALSMFALLRVAGAAAAAGFPPEAVADFRIDREAVYEFTKKPTVTRDGDTFMIRFASKGGCDATVVVEDENGRIVRHLAAGVLGPNAPEPFRRNSLEQTVIWNSKDDTGTYLDDLRGLRVRVSLGLKARYERDLQWHPKRRIGMRKMPRPVVQPEGVYVYEGAGLESIRLYGHDGKYIRTIHPFPSDTLKDVKGLGWYTFPDGHKAPRMRGYWLSTFLMGGLGRTDSAWGTSANAFDVRSGRIAIVSEWGLCRLKADATAGPFSMYGPEAKTSLDAQSIALSPDGKWLYLTGCYKTMNRHLLGTHLARVRWHHGLYRMAYAGDGPATLWKGEPGKAGKGDHELDHPSDVKVDDKGRVYVADNHNDRVQIYAPDGTLLKSLPVSGPAILQIHPKTGSLFVFSWTMALAWGYTAPPHKVQAALRVFEPFKSDEPLAAWPLPLRGYQGHTRGYMGSPHFDECPYRAAVDTYSDPPTLWLGTHWGRKRTDESSYSLSRYEIRGTKLVKIEEWGHEVAKAIRTWKPTRLARKRLYTDPRNGMLYVAESSPKALSELTRIDPETGKSSVLKLPYTAEEFAIDVNGNIYLRCAQIIGRHRLDNLREVPWDYGEERGFRWDSFARPGKLVSALVLPGNKPVWWHESGMSITPKGLLAVSCCNTNWKPSHGTTGRTGRYAPRVYPGRYCYSEIHIWDKHGKLVKTDVVPGLMDGHGTFIDPRGDIYYLAGGHRVYDTKGGPFDFLPLSGCVMKFKRGKAKLYATRKSKGVRVGLNEEIDLRGLPQVSCTTLGRFAIQGAEWIYPGIGYVHPNAPCQCWNCRFAVDTFGRVFAPETMRNQVAVLDTNGNLMMHIGKYGNADEGMPLVADNEFRSKPPRPVGGDEVALAYANYVATYTDHRLFIYDGANDRILGVKLSYHVDEMVELGARK
jgi:hypothetical protein